VVLAVPGFEDVAPREPAEHRAVVDGLLVLGLGEHLGFSLGGRRFVRLEVVVDVHRGVHVVGAAVGDAVTERQAVEVAAVVGRELEPLDRPVLDTQVVVTAVDPLRERVADSLTAGDLPDEVVDEVGVAPLLVCRDVRRDDHAGRDRVQPEVVTQVV